MKIRDLFNARGFDVLDINSTDHSPHIWDNIFDHIFNWFYESDQMKPNPRPDFMQIGTKQDEGPNNLYAKGWGAAIVYAENDVDKEKVKEAVIEVAQNIDLQKEAANLVRSGKQIITRVRTFGQKLSEKITQTEKY